MSSKVPEPIKFPLHLPVYLFKDHLRLYRITQYCSLSSQPPPCSVSGSITLPNSKYKNYAWYFPLPVPHKQLVTKSCWVKLQKVSGFCQMLFSCTAPDASDSCFYCYVLSSSLCQQFIHLQYFPMIIQNDLSKCRADQAISHWIPTAAYIKYQLFSMALHSLALTISVALTLTTFALQLIF